MNTNDTTIGLTHPPTSFYNRPEVHMEEIPCGPGVPFGVERIFNQDIGIGGAYRTWGESYDNEAILSLAKKYFGRPLSQEERVDLSPLGFHYRQHVGELSQEDHLEVELEVGARMLREAAGANGWQPGEVEGVLIGISSPFDH